MTTAALQAGAILVTPDPLDLRTIQSIPGVKPVKGERNRYLLDCTLDNLRALRQVSASLDSSLLETRDKFEKIETWIEETKRCENPQPLKPIPLKPGVQLYKHQIRAYNLALVLRNFAAFMDMGTGKTLTMVAVTARRYLDGKVSRVLIVAPTSVCAVWPVEYERYANIPCRVALLLGDRSKRLRALKSLSTSTPYSAVPPLRVAVVNYESTWRLEDELRAFAPEMIICDESQRIKGHAAQQSKAMHRLGEKAAYRVLLSGTPMQNDPRDFWSQYRFLSPTVFGRSFYAFQQRYTIMGGPGNHMMLGTRNLDELTRKVHSIAYRVTKTECLDMPPKEYETLRVYFTEAEKKLYDRIRKDSFLQLEKSEVTADNVLVRLLRLQQTTGGFLTDDNGKVRKVNGAKLAALEDLLTDYTLEQGKKLVVFSRFIAEMDAIEQLVQRLKIKYVSIRGGVSAGKRGDIVRQFQEDKGTMVFVGQIDAAAEGITLTAAHMVVYYSVNWNLAKYQQSQDRIHRIGQTNQCTYMHLIVPGTIDEQILLALSRKENMAKNITDNWRRFFEEEQATCQL